MLRKVNDNLEMTRKTVENLFYGIDCCYSYNEFKGKYIDTFLNYKWGKSLIKRCIGIILLTILLCSFIFLETLCIMILLVKLYIIVYGSLALIVGLGEFRLSSLKDKDLRKSNDFSFTGKPIQR